MGKTKKNSAQNPNAVTKQLIHGIKNGLAQENKSPKFKGVSGSKAALTNNSKMQNENKPLQKNLQKTTAKSNQDLLQNKKEVKEQYSLKRKKITLTKSQNKPAKKMKKELEVDDLWTYDESSNYEEEEVNDVPDKKVIKGSKSKTEKDNNNDDSDSSWYVDETEENEEVDDGPDVLKKNVVDESKEDHFSRGSSLPSDGFVTSLSDTDDEEKEVNDDVPSILRQSSTDESEEDFEEEDEDVEDDNKDDDDDDDEDNTDNEDENYEEKKKLVDIAADILKEACEEKYALPLSVESGKINRTTIKIANLPKDITEFEIRHYCEICGPIKSIKFKLDVPTCFNFGLNGRKVEQPGHLSVARVSALVDYHCPLDAEKALNMNGLKLYGNYVIVSYMNNMDFLWHNNNKYVVLKCMPEGVDINTIWNIFKCCGRIQYIYLHQNTKTGITNGQGVIYFMTKDGASKAENLNGTLIFDRTIQVKVGLNYLELQELQKKRENMIYDFLKNKKIVRALVEDRNWREKARQNKNLQPESK